MEGAIRRCAAEYERMIWAAAYLPVPTVVALEESDAATILVTEALAGLDATQPAWRSDLPALTRGPSAAGSGASTTRSGRNGAPSASTSTRPWPTWRTGCAALTFRRPASTPSTPGTHPPLRWPSWSRSAPAEEDLVVCHGDFCPPNALLEDWRVTGYVDLGELSVSDRWSDIAVGAWSVGWNFGPALEPLFYESYGIEPDPDRIRFFRLLYDLVS